MEKDIRYYIFKNEINTRKKLTQKEIEKNYFEEFDDLKIFETYNKEEAENTIKELVKYKYNSYNCYYKNYTYLRFELIKATINDDEPSDEEYESLGLYFPNYEKEKEEEEDE